jgi:hypothetical protein
MCLIKQRSLYIFRKLVDTKLEKRAFIKSFWILRESSPLYVYSKRDEQFELKVGFFAALATFISGIESQNFLAISVVHSNYINHQEKTIVFIRSISF